MIHCRELLHAVVAEHPHPLIFATLSGAHLYGFPSADSDLDLRGVHLMPRRDLFGLDEPAETIDSTGDREGREIDLVTHDARKFFRMMLKRNGYVLEQLFSPLVVHTTPAHAELIELGRGCVTRHHVHHYRGFAANQWALFQKDSPPRVKPLLYTYRVILTGIQLMRTGVIEASLPVLNESFALPYLPELIDRKIHEAEKERLNDADLRFHEGEVTRLLGVLDDAGERTSLPDEPSARAGLDDLLIRLRQSTPE